MATTQTRLETVTNDPTDDQTDVELEEFVAQTMPIGNDLPDFDQFSTACKVTKDTIERVINEEDI